MMNHDSNNAKDGLLADLESLRSVLDKDQRRVAEHSATDEPALLIDEVVAGALRRDDAAPGAQPGSDGIEDVLGNELLSALLTDAWKASAQEVLQESRAQIAQHRSRWLPEHTDRLNSALKTRIDVTMQTWIRDVVRRNLDDLRVALLRAITEQMREQIAEALEASETRQLSGDGGPMPRP